LPDLAALAQEAGRRFIASASTAISTSERFNVMLAGGSTPAGLYRLLAQTPDCEKVDWSRTFIYFGDERCVPPDHPDSNYRMARETLLDHVPLPPANIFRMAGELEPEVAAATYQRDLRQVFGLTGYGRPRFDLILLGMGADGHTASLFPGSIALAERRRSVVATAVPAGVHPAVRRITVTFPVLNAGWEVLFLVAGANKAEAVRAVLTGPPPAEPLPARRVRPRRGTLTWLLDEAAAGGLG